MLDRNTPYEASDGAPTWPISIDEIERIAWEMWDILDGTDLSLEQISSTQMEEEPDPDGWNIETVAIIEL